MANSQTFRQVRVSPPQDFANARGGRSAEAAVRLFDYISNRIIGKLYEAQCLHYCFENDVQHASLDVGKSFVFYVADQRQQALEVFRNAINATVRFGSLSALLYNKNTKSVFAFPTVETESKEENAEFDADVYRLNVKNITALKEHAKFCAPSVSCEVLPSFVADANVVLPQSVDEDCRLSDVLREILSQPLPLWFYALKFSGWKVRERNVGDGLLLLYAREPLSQDELIGTEFWFTRWAAILSNESFSRIRDEWAVKSAVGSIMSRNGSHNIGSHVLAALSHNVGTMPDDRVLYQYIQNRMDYIATVTTDPPVWTQSTLLMGSLIRGFLVQYHLLDHIAESEGLRAYVFQMHSKKLNIRNENASGKIELHVRKQVVKGTYRELIEYDSGIVHLDDDVALAIPGGVVGTHAFYTILENVIRNAAKHGWSNPGKGVESRKANEGNLKVYVDFAENDEDVEFEVWDNMSNVFGSSNGEIAEELVAPLTKKELADCQQSNALKSDAVTGLPLHHQQQLKLAQKFITESGSLRQENWGLAEMKISAGFLVRRTVSEIGGLDEAVNDCERKDKRILLPKAVRHGDLYHLGYQFSIPKPMDVVFVLDKTSFAGEDVDTGLFAGGDPVKQWLSDNESRRGALKQYGIYFYSQTEARNLKGIASQYVVFSDFSQEDLTIGLPFRVMTMREEEGRFRSDLVPVLDFMEIRNAVQSIEFGRIGSAQEVAEKIKLMVWGRWIEFLWGRRQNAEIGSADIKKLSLLINAEGDDSGAGRGLITDRDLLAYVFKHCVRSTIRSFLAKNGGVTQECRNVLTVLADSKYDMSVPADVGAYAVDTLIALKVIEWLDGLLANKGLNERVYLETEITKLKLCYEDRKLPFESELARKEYSAKRYQAKCHPSEMEGFVVALRAAFEQADVFLRKYEEDIVTLPTGFKVESDQHTGGSFCWPSGKDLSAQEALVKVCFERSQVEGCSIEYVRHFDPEQTLPPSSAIYVEPLSGSQCYMNSVKDLQADGKGSCSDVVLVKLLESGLIRVAIADERVAKFCRDHANMRKTYECLRIGILDDKEFELKKALDSRTVEDGVQGLVEIICTALERQNPSFEPQGLASRWDMFIIHQGLIDKWLDKHGSKDVEDFLGRLKGRFPYVIVTTGRGRPANIPPSARVVPFSTVENTLFKKYPEKMVLVDTVMNVLPVGCKGDE